MRAEESNDNVIFHNRVNDTGIPSGIASEYCWIIPKTIWSTVTCLTGSLRRHLHPIVGFTGIVLTEGATRNVITGNRVFNQFGVGILLDQDATQNVILGNRAENNKPWDAQNDNTGCDANIWRANQFNRVNQSCIR